MHSAREAQVAVAALQALAQRKGHPGMNTSTAYTVKHIQLLTHSFNLESAVLYNKKCDEVQRMGFIENNPAPYIRMRKFESFNN